MRTRVSSLVSAKWLADKIQAGAKVHVTHSIYQPKSDSTGSFMSLQYLQAHIPNSSYTNLYELADSDSRIPLTIPTAEQFADYASERGIRNDDHVVIYDNTPPLAFHYSVCRTWLLFKLFGHTHVSILHGGLAAWIEAGQSVTDKIPEFIKSEYEATLNERLSRSYEDIVRNSKSQNAEFQLIDARGSSGFNAGSVPGSKNIPFSNFYNDDGSFKDFEQIEEVFEKHGVDVDAPIVSTCRSGVSACLLSFAANQIGITVPFYDGSWTEIMQKGGLDKF